MTACGYLQQMSDQCIRIAGGQTDDRMRTFFSAAAEGFRRRLERSDIDALREKASREQELKLLHSFCL